MCPGCHRRRRCVAKRVIRCCGHWKTELQRKWERQIESRCHTAAVEPTTNAASSGISLTNQKLISSVPDSLLPQVAGMLCCWHSSDEELARDWAGRGTR